MHPVFRAPDGGATPIYLVDAKSFADGRGLAPAALGFARAAGWEPKAGRHLLLPGEGGGSKLAGVLFGVDVPDAPACDPFGPGRLPGLLPAGTYRVDWRAVSSDTHPVTGSIPFSVK